MSFNSSHLKLGLSILLCHYSVSINHRILLIIIVTDPKIVIEILKWWFEFDYKCKIHRLE